MEMPRGMVMKKKGISPQWMLLIFRFMGRNWEEKRAIAVNETFINVYKRVGWKNAIILGLIGGCPDIRRDEVWEGDAKKPRHSSGLQTPKNKSLFHYIESVQIHHFYPSSYKVFYKLLLGVAAGVNLSKSTQFAVRSKN